MAMPKRKVSKMKRRQRQAHNRYEGVHTVSKRQYAAGELEVHKHCAVRNHNALGVTGCT